MLDFTLDANDGKNPIVSAIRRVTPITSDGLHFTYYKLTLPWSGSGVATPVGGRGGDTPTNNRWLYK